MGAHLCSQLTPAPAERLDLRRGAPTDEAPGETHLRHLPVRGETSVEGGAIEALVDAEDEGRPGAGSLTEQLVTVAQVAHETWAQVLRRLMLEMAV